MLPTRSLVIEATPIISLMAIVLFIAFASSITQMTKFTVNG